MQPPLQLSIIIVNWNSKDYVRKCVQSIDANTTGISYEIIVVDGASYDGCGEMLAREFPSVKFIQSEKNVGFSRANNLGFEQSSGACLLFLNPDTEVQGNAIQTLMEHLQRLPKAGLLGARLLNSNGSLQTSSVQSDPTPLNQALGSEFLFKVLPNSRLWGIHVLQRVEATEVDTVSGACMLIPRPVFQQVKGFDPKYFMYCEDMDICLQIRRRGYKVYFIPDAQIIHHGGGSSSRQFNKFTAVLMRESILLYFQTNHGKLLGYSYRTLMALSALFRLPLLLTGYSLKRLGRRNPPTSPIKKWLSILSWAMGRETWVRTYKTNV